MDDGLFVPTVLLYSKMMLFALFKKRTAPEHDRHYKYIVIYGMNGQPDRGIIKFI